MFSDIMFDVNVRYEIWDEKYINDCTYAEFSIEDGSIKTGCMSWAANTGKGTMRGMEAPIELTGIYPINWKEYSKVDDTNSGTFMYLVNRISKEN